MKLNLLSRRKILKTNLVFILVFLVIWELLLSGELFNGMIFGLMLFGPVAFLWYLDKIRASMIATLVSVFEVTILAVFLVESIQFGGAAATVKSIYWIPYFAMAVINTIVGLRIYKQSFSANRQRILQIKRPVGDQTAEHKKGQNDGS